MREQNLGAIVRFLLPSLKLKGRGRGAQTVELEVHEFLMREFGGYTAAAGNIFGYWRSPEGEESYGEHREFRVALSDPTRLGALKRFLADVARQLEEESIYVEVSGEALLIYAAE